MVLQLLSAKFAREKTAMDINYRLNTKKLKYSYKLIAKDFAKVNIGLAVSIFVVYLIQLIKTL
tara:strand:+ start:75037 stop:75225 length:189 start_codon:yes stop_codon:yes gene_type:complete